MSVMYSLCAVWYQLTDGPVRGSGVGDHCFRVWDYVFVFIIKRDHFEIEWIRFSCRCSALSRAGQTQLQAHLSKYLMESCQGEVCVLAALDWVKDNLHLFINQSSLPAQTPKKESSCLQDVFSRLWIYSHHIYNKSKRKNILEWSKELGLSGFSMPGKPGVVCVEGPQSACEEFWSRCFSCYYF